MVFVITVKVYVCGGLALFTRQIMSGLMLEISSNQSVIHTPHFSLETIKEATF
jgi:hypothetical protein